MSRLRVPPMQDKADDKMTPILVSCGILIGSTIILMVMIIGIIIYGDLTVSISFNAFEFNLKKNNNDSFCL